MYGLNKIKIFFKFFFWHLLMLNVPIVKNSESYHKTVCQNVHQEFLWQHCTEETVFASDTATDAEALGNRAAEGQRAARHLNTTQSQWTHLIFSQNITPSLFYKKSHSVWTQFQNCEHLLHSVRHQHCKYMSHSARTPTLQIHVTQHRNTQQIHVTFNLNNLHVTFSLNTNTANTCHIQSEHQHPGHVLHSAWTQRLQIHVTSSLNTNVTNAYHIQPEH